MKTEKQRIAIAEWYGWKWVQGDEPTYGGRYKQSGWRCGKRFVPTHWEKTADGLPRFDINLNAVHNAVLKLPDNLRSAYYCHLLDILKRNHSKESVGGFHIATAEVYEMTEALLRTIGKWEDA